MRRKDKNNISLRFRSSSGKNLKLTMISRDNITLRPIILLQFRNPTGYLRLVYSDMIFFIPWRGLKSIFKGTEEASFIRKC